MSKDSSEQPSSGPADKPQTKPFSKQVNWGPASAIILTISIFLIAQIMAALTLGFVLGLLQWSTGQVETWLETVAGQFIFVLITEALTVGSLWWFLRHRRASFRALGFHRNPVWKDLGLAAAGFGVYLGLFLVAATLAALVFQVDTSQEQQLGFEQLVSNGDRLMGFIGLVVLAPVVEELLFRGFMFGGLRRKLGFWGTTIITSLVFASPHLLQADVGLLWIGFVDTFVLSLVLCYLREKTGNLWASIGLHMMKNGLAFLVRFVFV